MIKIILFFTVIITISACSSKEKHKQVIAESNSEFENFSEYADKSAHLGQKPSDVAIFFQLTEASFMPQLINNPSNYSKYASSTEFAAANIGVYWVDALYQYSYKQKDGAKESAEAAIKLAESLEIGDAFKDMLITKYTENAKPDSFFLKLDECFMNAEYILSERACMRIIYLSMLVGKYIQTQYVFFSLIFDYPDDVDNDVKLVLLQDLLFNANQNIKSTGALVRLINKYEKPDYKGILSKEIKEFGENCKLINFEGGAHKLSSKDIFDNDTLKTMYKQIKYMRDYVIMAETK